MPKAKKKPTSVTLFCAPVCYDENGCDAAWAVVTLTKAFIATLISRIDLFRGLKHAITHLCHIEEFDYAVDYYTHDALDSSVTDAPDGIWTRIAVEKLPKAEDQCVRVDCPVLVVDELYVHWDAYIKHTQIHVATAHFSREELMKLAKSLADE